MGDLSPTDEDDLRLMALARDGDVDAFTTLVHRHRNRLIAFLGRLSGDRDRAEDAAQEVFLKLWLARARYEPRARFTTFLYGIAYRHWIDAGRKARSRPAEVELLNVAEGRPGTPLPMAPAATEPHAQLFLRYEQRRIREAIAALPDAYRVVFVLAHLEDRRIAEIADLLGIPEGTVKSRMHAAVRMLRTRLTADDRSEDSSGRE